MTSIFPFSPTCDTGSRLFALDFESQPDAERGSGPHMSSNVPRSVNRVLYDRLECLFQKYPDAQDILSTPFRVVDRVANKKLVNQSDYLDQPGLKVELSVQLVEETHEGRKFGAPAIIRCLPSRVRSRCVWALIRPDHSWDFVRYHKTKPAGYRRYDQAVGRLRGLAAVVIHQRGRRDATSDFSDDRSNGTYRMIQSPWNDGINTSCFIC
jgi:hypothetical protein